MKPLYTTLPFLFLFIGALSQNPLIDSLRQELNKAEADTSVINYSIDLAIQLSGIHPDSTLLLCQTARALVPGLENPEAKVMGWRKVALGYHAIRQLDTALLFLQKAKNLAQETGYLKGHALTLNSMGNVYRSKDDPGQAIEHFRQSLDLHKERGDRNEQTATLNNIAIIFMEQGDYLKAVLFFEEALKLQESMENEAYQGLILQNLALCERRQGNFQEAIDHYQHALGLHRKTGNKNREAQVLALMGIAYEKQGSYSHSLALNQEALHIRKALGNKKLIAFSLINIGNIYFSLADYPQSTEYYQTALDTLERLGDKYTQVRVLRDIGRNLKIQKDYRTALLYQHRSLQLGREVWPERLINSLLYGLGSTYEKMDLLDSAGLYLNEALAYSRKYKDARVHVLCLTDLGRLYRKKGDVSRAITVLEKAYSISGPAAYPVEKKDVVEQLYQVYKEQNDLSRALYYHECFKSLQDTLFNEENTKTITRLELEYGFEQEKQELAYHQEKEALVLNNRLQRQHSVQIGTIMALVLSLIFIIIIARYYRLNRKANRELSQLNKEITTQKEQLQQLDQVKTRFFTNISHEFRTPLTIIDGTAGLIEKSPGTWFKKGLQMIRRNNANLLNLVNQILDLRKLETGVLELNLVQGDIVSYLQYILESFQCMAEEKGITLHLFSDEMSIVMDYDKEKILSIVSNLLSNAIKFGVDGGQVYLMISRITGGTTATEALEIKFKDKGVGIDQSKLPYIFDRFYQVSPDCQSNAKRSEGTGIGLSLTKALVELMKGTIQVESMRGKGTTFSVLLPISRTAPMEAPKETVNEEITEKQDTQSLNEKIAVKTSIEAPLDNEDKPSLLIIEDNMDVAEYLEFLLGSQYYVYTVHDGEKGIETALNRIPDIILSDAMMPGKSGFEVCSILKEDDRSSHIPIVLLTAKTDTESKITALECGANAYVPKPFNEKDLKDTLEKLLKSNSGLQKRYHTFDQRMTSGGKAIQREDAFIVKLRDAIEANLRDEKFGASELCEEIGMGISQLHRKIKALTDRPACSFIRLIRLQKAKELLQQSDLSIADIAYEVGFKDLSCFSQSFIEEFGISPGEFSKY